jgi:hypothetical protein
MAEFAGLPLSESVTAVSRELADSGPVTSWEVVKALLKLHPEYGRGHGKTLLIGFPPEESPTGSTFQGETRPVREWLDAVTALYEPALEFLDGRLVIIGLTMIDRNLGEFIARGVPDFIEILQHEGEGKNFWGKPFEKLLIQSGPGSDSTAKPEPKQKPPPTPPPSENDPAVQHDDSPAQKDVLGRSGFAQALAIWLTRLWKKNQPAPGKAAGNSFVMNIYGPWGSGKSSLLNLLKANLEPNPPGQKKSESPQPPAPGQGQSSEPVEDWIVVEFNAWQPCMKI